ncbi:hypothetical protein FKP32DRAFT_1678600 [Trametes sanguinea]|nr:hypothetical protein FKP32DRAFT_1678600 [Trametes sanguinea]
MPTFMRLVREDATGDSELTVPLMPPTTLAARDTDAPSASTSSQMPEGVIIGLVLACVAILGVAVMISLCLRSMKSRREQPPTRSAGHDSAHWMGVASVESTHHTASIYSIPEKAPQTPDTGVQPAAVLPRLSPNRRLPSCALDIAASWPPQEMVRTPTPEELDAGTMDAAREDSPTLPPPTPNLSTPPKLHVVTRKPIPARFSSHTMTTEHLSSKVDGPMTAKEVPSNTVSRSPSTANSAMQQIWESGFHVQRRSHLDRDMARASSIIDPHLFGEAKTMHAVIPDVPFLVSKGVRVEP